MTFYRYQDAAEYNWLMTEVLRHETLQAMALGRLLYKYLKPRSVIDVGCGPGIYLVPFKSAGCEVYGIDGAPSGGECLAPNEFELVDLRNPWTPEHSFDLALCIETGEHLQPEHHVTLAETISRCAPIIFWSAAPPGQGGEGHHGERPKAYWIETYARLGYKLHNSHRQIELDIQSDETYDHCGWLKNNTIVFTK